jgi:hypothetical protein
MPRQHPHDIRIYFLALQALAGVENFESKYSSGYDLLWKASWKRKKKLDHAEISVVVADLPIVLFAS